MLNENSIGSKIKSIREQKGLNQIDVVLRLVEKKINMSRETLSKIENDNRSISAVELKALCSVLGIDISSIFDEEETDDLVTLFRKKGNFTDETIKEIESLQDMIKIFISQKEIYSGEFKVSKKRPMWEECLN